MNKDNSILKPFLNFVRFIERYTYYIIGWLSPFLLTKILFLRRTGKFLNLNNPKDLNEKIQWLKLYSDTSQWPDLADKYRVRKYVEDCGCGEMLNELYGVWEDAENIDFEILPDSFVLKSNNGCGTVLVVEDKQKIDYGEVRKMMKSWLNEKFGILTAEPHYLEIKPCIIAEKLLKPESELSSSLIDYKFFCLNGEPYSCLVCYDRIKEHPTLELYDIKKWEAINYNMPDGKYGDKRIPRPVSLDKMIEAARKLSVGFPSVRVDFYEINGKPVFGELTFTSCAGFMDYFTPAYLLEMGNRVMLPSKKRTV